ncbi:MAG: preprotein translocase subunit YajC [Nitrosomonadales bacterium]|nr:MAG: preprotein translocase subunit YajC [Nitrosomonadales bacterium]
MSRLLFFAIIVVLVFWLIKRVTRKKIDLNIESSTIEGENMVCCDYCGLHLPRSESITKENKFFCNEEHCRLHSK